MYVVEEDVLVAPMSTFNISSSSAPSSRATGSRSPSIAETTPPKTEPEPAPITPSTLLQDYKALSRVITSNMDVLKGRPMFPGEQAQIQAVQAGTTKLEAATTALVTSLQQV